MFKIRKIFLFHRSFNVAEKNISGKEPLKLAILISFLLCIGHLLLGSGPIVVFLSVFIIILGTVPLSISGFFNIGAVFVFLVAFRYVDFASVAKLFMLQSLDSNLCQPIEAFFAVLLSLIGYLVAFFVAREMRIGKSLLKPVLKEGQLFIISILSAVVGSLAWFGKIESVNMTAIGVDISHKATVYAFFTPFFLLAIVAATAHTIVASGGKKSISIWIIILLIVQLIFSFIANSRMLILNGLLAYLTTIVSFYGKIKLRNLGLIAMGIAIMIYFITPIMLYVRNFRGDCLQKIG